MLSARVGSLSLGRRVGKTVEPVIAPLFVGIKKGSDTFRTLMIMHI